MVSVAIVTTIDPSSNSVQYYIAAAYTTNANNILQQPNNKSSLYFITCYNLNCTQNSFQFITIGKIVLFLFLDKYF